MKKTIKQWTLSGLAIIVALSFGIVSIPAQTTMNAKEMRKQQKEGRNEVREATKVFREIMSVPEKGIPRELLEKAEAVGVFPNVVKAGFIVGGRGGDGERLVCAGFLQHWRRERRSANRREENRLHYAVYERRRAARFARRQTRI